MTDYAYDYAGRVESETRTSITTHDMRNRLISMGSYYSSSGFDPVVGVAYNSWLMEYDADGRRIFMSSNLSTNLSFVHAGDMEIADIDHTSGKILRRYVPGAMIDERVAMITTVAGTCTGPCGAASREFYHTNRLGTVIAMADESGALTAQYIYTPFGVETPVNGSANPFRYTGQRADAETGLMYYRARYYDPAAGRFLQTDPVMYSDQMNLYAYVGNGPLMATDPTGMQVA